MSYSRKLQQANVLHEFPRLSESSKIVRVVELRGANVCEVEVSDGRRMLCQIPQKFRKLIWIKRGSYLIVREPEALANVEVKIRCMVEHVLFPDHVKNLKQEGHWPQEFEEKEIPDKPNKKQLKKPNPSQLGSDDEEDDDLDGLFVNPNHQLIEDSDDEEDEDGLGQ